MAELMVGAVLTAPERGARKDWGDAQAALQVVGLSASSPIQFGTSLKDVTFSVARGEVLGIAGVAGVGLALLSPVNPTVGAAYIVNAFLVVVVGGVGSVLGAGAAALLLGFTTALAEGITSSSLAQAIMLILVVAFLQWKPKGLIPTRSRALEEA